MLVLVPRVLSVRVRFTAVETRTLSKKGMVVKKARWSLFAVVVVYRAVFISSYTHTVSSHEQSSPVATETLSAATSSADGSRCAVCFIFSRDPVRVAK